MKNNSILSLRKNFHLFEQQSVGLDGAVFDAIETTENRRCKFVVLSESALERVRKRLAIISQLQAPVFRRVLGIALNETPPWIALEARTDCLLVNEASLPWPANSVLDCCYDLLQGISEAHRLGLVLNLRPSRIYLEGIDVIRIDPISLQLGASAEMQKIDSLFVNDHAESPSDPASDLFHLGTILHWIWTKKRPTTVWDPVHASAATDEVFLHELIQQLMVEDPVERPSAAELCQLLAAQIKKTALAPELSGSRVCVVSGNRADSVPSSTPVVDCAPVTRSHHSRNGASIQLGRYLLHEMLGQGGMGRVYRATDTSDGSTVAVKILHDHLGANSNVVKRLHREARLLAKIANPFIVNLLELNRDGDQHYLVMEFVNGVSLDSILKDQQICPDGKVPEAFAVAIGTEMALALADAHRQDIIHRDVKPHNIMLVRGSQWYAKIHGQSVVTSPVTGSAKLCDFGLARMMTPTDSDHLTRSGAVLGTPWYMAPEQALGRPDVGPQADVYSLGATLFHLLAGRPPFLADSSTAMTLKHVNERAPALRQFNSAISEPLCRIIEKCLAKRPEDRFRDAADLYEELARLQRGEPTRFIAHPRLPPTVGQVHEYLWTWEMQAPAEAIWPHVANTERFNRATGIPPVEFHSQSYPTANTSKLLPEVRRFGRLRVKGLTLDWREHPFEWIEGQRHSVLREYTHGPVRWLISSVELTPRADGGCTLTHHLRFEPRHFLGRMVAALEVGWKARRAFDRVYRRIDAFAQGADIPDPFELPPVMTRQQRHRMNHIIDQMATIVPYTVLETLADYLTQASSQDIARIKPLELARQLNLDPEHLIPAFLHGARLGLFMMLWDVLCPRCRTSASFAETLRSLAQHSHCPACQFDFPLDFTQSVELVFRVHPQIRACETRTYCVGGPAHFPHIVAQIRVGSQECFRLHLNLSPGTYRITGPQFAQSWDFDVLSNRGVGSWQLLLPDDLVSIPHSSYTHQPKVSFRARKQELLITNQHDQELLIRVERTVNRTDALTPARLSSMPLFRQLFPSEVLRSGQLLSLSTLTFLAIDFHVDSQIHDTQGNTLEPQQGRAIHLIYDFFQFARETAPKYGGLVVKSLGERLLMVFDQKLQALRTALELRRRTQQPEKPDNTRARQYVRMGIHSGPAVLMTINDQMEYFGPTLTQTWQMPDRLHRGQIGLSFALASDPHIDEFLRGENLPTKLVDGSTANGTPYLVL